MLFTETDVAGAWVLAPEKRSDERGFFARLWCEDEAAAHGLEPRITQVNGSYNEFKGTLRGLHMQRAPHSEAKVVRCTRGVLFDVVADLRPDSPTFLKWFGVTLDPENRLALYVPPGCAHGYQTLADQTEVFYQVSAPYTPSAEAGARHDDPALGIRWPLEVTSISDKDLAWPAIESVNGVN
jgi:dTDP-4-dehydrorhamnose 3,5-epimerase